MCAFSVRSKVITFRRTWGTCSQPTVSSYPNRPTAPTWRGWWSTSRRRWRWASCASPARTRTPRTSAQASLLGNTCNTRATASWRPMKDMTSTSNSMTSPANSRRYWTVRRINTSLESSSPLSRLSPRTMTSTTAVKRKKNNGSLMRKAKRRLRPSSKKKVANQKLRFITSWGQPTQLMGNYFYQTEKCKCEVI